MEIKNIYLVLLFRVKAFAQHLLFKYTMVGNFCVLKSTYARLTDAGYDSASIQRWLNYHNQHESAALIGLFHVAFSVLPPVESYRKYRKPTQRGVQGYLFSLQRRVDPSQRGAKQYLLLKWH